MRKSLWLVCLLGIFASPLSASTLDEVRILAEGGAAQLAIHLVDRYQPDNRANRQQWLAWEQTRLQVYRQSRDWQQLTRRVDSMPGDVPSEFADWARTEQAYACIQSGNTDKAINILRALIWQKNPSSISHYRQYLPRWRQLVINSYIKASQLQDAKIAGLRYYQEYSSEKLEDKLLQARLALINGDPDDALRVLQDHAKKPEAVGLVLLAKLRSKKLSPFKVLKASLDQLELKSTTPAMKIHLWATIAEAAKHNGDRATMANALEHVIAGLEEHTLPDGLFEYSADNLWNAYIDFATWLGNRQQFLIGQDEKWFKAAQQAEKKQPVRARSLYALLMLKGQDVEYKNKATQAFIKHVKSREQGNTLLLSLFMKSKQFPRYELIPVAVRHALVDIALANSNIQQAADLMATIKEPPIGSDNYFWHLRRARIFVLGGNSQQGVEALHKLIIKRIALPREQADMLMQVVFDLQTLGEHENAINLLELVLGKTADMRLQREIFFWMADSFKAQQKYQLAARFYLRSAMHIANLSMDPWSQTARYNAAESLGKAGLISDARRLLKDLLLVTKDPARRSALEHELQKLWLLKDGSQSEATSKKTTG